MLQIIPPICFIFFNYSPFNLLPLFPIMKKKIFVVEKDEAILEVITHILTEEGYKVISSRTEEGIVEHVLKFKPDAILLDIITPTEEGTKLCRSLKANKKTKYIPVIVLSTHIKVPESIKEVCADDALAKPFNIADLLSIIEGHIADKNSIGSAI